VHGIKSGEPLLQVWLRDQKLAKIEARHPAEPIARSGNRHICTVLAPLQQFGCKRSRQSQRSFDKVIQTLAVQHRHDLWRPVELLAQSTSTSTSVSLPHCRGGIALRRGQRPGEGDLQFEFLPLTRSTVMQARQQL
jgi:hypothetical protein